MAESGRAPIICDLDGVLWRGDDPIPGSADAIAALRRDGFPVTFLSNNSNLTVGGVAAKLTGMGVPTEPTDVLTSALAAADQLQQSLAPGARVLACAGPGVVEALVGGGFTVVDDAPAAAVVVGMHRDFDFDGLDRASRAIRDGARFIATNTDATYPVASGLLPGAGALVAAVATASGREPEVVGKPHAAMVAMVRHHFGVLGVDGSGIVIGDRPTTDGALADALGWPFALVLSGVTGKAPGPGGEAIPDPPPPFVADDLAQLVPRLINQD